MTTHLLSKIYFKKGREHSMLPLKEELINNITAGRWRLMPIILTTLEAEIRRIKVRSQHRQIVHKILS
jgi:hypothetical protein